MFIEIKCISMAYLSCMSIKDVIENEDDDKLSYLFDNIMFY